MKKPTCETCVYFIPSEIEGDHEGDCRKNPPILNIEKTSNGGITLSSYFTVSCSDDFCGDHQDFPEYIAQVKKSK